MRQIVLDTETTGLEPAEGHRIIEIGCVELVDRRLTRNNFHQYLRPDREIDQGAVQVHGITDEFLRDKPRFDDIAEDFIGYVRGAELIIHNAPFDVGFLNHELGLWREDAEPIDKLCRITDTLVMARSLHPGQRNSLDALCKRYEVDNSQRDLHGALLDAEILADLYLAMSGGQVSLALGAQDGSGRGGVGAGPHRLTAQRPPLMVVRADAEESAAHQARLAAIEAASGGECLWLKTWMG
ncbi:DNA polymerase III subunit epsilon [Candidatus Thiosymbion oneisti]|uniref:DNA polymerase III subunit epsilon n=1 Tax=Candidatus Thiosymbion oneisti TaxID=589554 RepID=UPI000B2ADF93|nr:DNA polymerase III subunit epsilon [Candidatus Thiosymbion oneisti]